ncbi:hypothetical protein [Agrococcus sp. DT81.2]|uniref:hypothetical protein n=1 Tax=Agrococcus sp. DT81.2 TaxID=3393414 RepID=UPI003CE5221A
MTLSNPDDPAGAPPPPGSNTPVPADAASRAAAAGLARRLAATAPPAADQLVPAKALETRAEERARLRRERLALGPVIVQPQVVANPAAGLAPQGAMLPPGFVPAVAESMPQRLVPSGFGQPPYGQPPSGQLGDGLSPYAQPAYGPPAYGAPAYAQPGYGMPSYGAQPPYGLPVYPQVVMLPPRIRWSKRQRAAALLSSWVGQTLMALATHFLTTFFLIVGFAFLLHVSGDDVAEFEADSFTTVVSLWSTPDRVWATALIGLLIGGGILALGWLTNALWAKSAGLAKPHRSTWLAWLCTTAATGLVGLLVWPMALFGSLFFIVAASSASLTVGSMWTALFTLLAIAIALTGGVGLLFGWLYLASARPRIDFAALAEAEEAEARARDEAELTRVQLRGDPARR